jgi:replication factor C small subunit
MKKGMWSEDYRPTSIDDYVFKDEDLKSRVMQWIDNGEIPHVTFCGPAGTGKTTLAFLLLDELGVQECDVLYISASVNNGIDYIREKVVGFAETIPFGEFKYVILDECDYVTHNGQAALRGIMQDYTETTRFILTCNFVGKIMDPLLSRSPSFTIDALDMTEYKTRAAAIIMDAGVDFSEEDIPILDEYAKKTYPDLRKCINKMQLSCVGNKILPYSDDANGENEIFLEMVTLFKSGKIKEAREYICKNISHDQYISAYRFLYDNIELFARDINHECECLALIKEGLVEHATAGDAEICLSGTLAKIYIS